MRTTSVPPLLAACLLAVLLSAAPPAALADGERPAPEQSQAEHAAVLIAGMKTDDPEKQALAAHEAASNPHPSLLKPLLRLLGNPEQGVREAATKALATRAEKHDRKRAAAGLNPRLARLSRKAEDHDELMVVIAALEKLAQRSSVKPLIDGIDLETDEDEVVARLNAVAAVPHAEAIDRLIQFLAKGRRGPARKQREAAAKALQYATGERFGHDPDRWRAWWREHEKTFNFEAMAEARAQAEAERQEKAARRKEREERRGKKGEKRKKKGDDGDGGDDDKPKKPAKPKKRID